MNNLVTNSLNFIKKHISGILFVVFVLFAYLTVKVLYHLNGDKGEKTIKKIYVIESFENDDIFKNGLCKATFGKSHLREKACNSLTKENCELSECCIYNKTADGQLKCVAGNDRDGPTYK